MCYKLILGSEDGQHTFMVAVNLDEKTSVKVNLKYILYYKADRFLRADIFLQ